MQAKIVTRHFSCVQQYCMIVLCTIHALSTCWAESNDSIPNMTNSVRLSKASSSQQTESVLLFDLKFFPPVCFKIFKCNNKPPTPTPLEWIEKHETAGNCDLQWPIDCPLVSDSLHPSWWWSAPSVPCRTEHSLQKKTIQIIFFPTAPTRSLS